MGSVQGKGYNCHCIGGVESLGASAVMCCAPRSGLPHPPPPISSHSVCEPVLSALQAQGTELCLQSLSPTDTWTTHAQCRPPKSTSLPWESTPTYPGSHLNITTCWCPESAHGKPSPTSHMLQRGEPEPLQVHTASCTPHGSIGPSGGSIAELRPSGFKSQLMSRDTSLCFSFLLYTMEILLLLNSVLFGGPNQLI